MDEEAKRLLDESMRTMQHEFETVKVLLDTYLKHTEPYDPEGKYFRLRFMEKICSDLITILEAKGVDADIMNGTEAALRIFENSKYIGEFKQDDGR